MSVPQAPRRPSYSIHHVMSARYGVYLNLTDRLHSLLLTRADTTARIAAYAVYSPTFTFVVRGKEREAKFTLAAQFGDGRREFWDSTWERTPDLDSPLHRAQRAHAESFGAVHRLYTVEELEANWTLLKNRATVQAILGAGYATDTQSLEEQVLARLLDGTAASLAVLAAGAGVSLAMTRLAAFRLVVSGHVTSEMETRLIGPEWAIRRAAYAST